MLGWLAQELGGERALDFVGGGEGHISPWVLGAYLASTTHSAPPSPPFSPPPWLTKLVAFMSMMPSEISPGPTASAGGEGQLQINPYLL